MNLKSAIMIDVDTTREQPITFSKPETENEPQTREDAFNMVLTDVKCLTFGLATLINLAHANGFADRDLLLSECVKALTLTLEDAATNDVGVEKSTTNSDNNSDSIESVEE